MNLTMPQLLSYFEIWVSVLSEFWTLLNMNIGTIISNMIGSGSLLLAPVYAVLEVTGINQLSLLTVMIGAGFIAYIVYQLVSWLLNLIT